MWYGVGMNKDSINLDELATMLSALSAEQREQLELALSPSDEQEISRRYTEVGKLTKQGKLLTTDDLADI